LNQLLKIHAIWNPLKVELLDKKSNKIILNDIGKSAGIKVAGDYKKLIK
tara:strand:- start:116 stop:262 length:147 start_codon:yes stop_codon:yes gene_type:complete